MASGVIPMTCDKGGPWAGKIVWSSQLIPEAGASNLSASCYVWRTDGSSSQGPNPYFGKMTIDRKEVILTLGRITSREALVGSGWCKVLHNSNGTGFSKITAFVMGSQNNDLTGKTLRGSQTVTMDPILLAGPSSISLGAETLQMGKKLRVSIHRDQTDCVHDLSYTFGNASGTIASQVGESFDWTLPDLAAYCELSGTCTVFCKTYRKGNYLGSSQAQFTMQVPDPAVPGLDTAVLGTQSQISCPRKSGNFSLKLSLLLENQEFPIGEGMKNTFSWTPEYKLAALKKDLTVITGTLRCRTYNGSVFVGTRDHTVRLTVPENEFTRPRIREMNLKPILNGVPEKFRYLRGKTGLQADFLGDSDCSDITEYTLSLGSETVHGNPAKIPVLSLAGLLKVRGQVRDLRGFTGSVTQEIQVVPYGKPRVVPASGKETVICQRALASGALSPQGTFLAIQAGVRFTSVIYENQEQNSAVLRYRIRQGEGTFGPWNVLNQPGETEVKALIPDAVSSLQHSYQVELSAVDALGEENRTRFEIMSQAISFVLYDGVDGAAFGKYPESPHVVDLAPQMTLLVRGKLDNRGEVWEDLGLAPGIQPPQPETGRAEGCAMRLSGGSHVILAFSCRMPEGHLAVNANPVPQALRPPRKIHSLCPSQGGITAAECGPDGFIYLENVLGTADAGWVDGYLDYYI